MQPALARQAVAQHGAFTRQQALAAGVTSARCRGAVTRGEWLPLLGSWVVAGTPVTQLTRLWAVYLRVGRPMAFSHRSAALLWQLPGVVAATTIDIRVPSARRLGAVAGVRLHLSTGVAPVSRSGLPVTSLPTTLLDLAGVLKRPQLRDLLAEQLRRRSVSAADIAGQLGRGRSGAAALRAVLAELADEHESVWERRLARLLVLRGLPRPTPQYPIRGPGGFLAYADLAYPQARLVLEVDGYLAHSSPDSFRRDRHRQNVLAGLGWTVLRYPPNMIRDQPDTVVAQVRWQLTAVA
ncbi:MAG: DUF559 domain-containing protein [Mycobacteriales bacterium]